MAESFVAVERKGPVALVRLDRPKANALSSALLHQLAGAVSELAADPPGAVVVWGGERIFAAGADINEIGDPRRQGGLIDAFREAFDAIAAFPRATLAAVAGYALGGGCELALACDLRMAASSARIGQPEIFLGIIPGAGGTQRLTRLVGPARAKDLVLTGRQVGAEEALSIGLVDRVVPAEALLASALGLAGELAAGALVAQSLAKQAIDAALDLPLAEGLSLERRLFERSLSTEDARIGIETFLSEGPGKARFRGA